MTNKNKVKPTANNVKCWDSNGSTPLVTQRLEEMFVEMGQKTRIEKGQKPAERAVFRKQHGIVYGNFIINKDIPEEYKIGIFAGDSYECAVRFSSDISPTSPDLHSTVGVGLKLFGVEGPKLFGEGSTADFIFQNIDRFFARDAQQMCSFTTAGTIDHDYDAYINKHPKLRNILKAMAKEEASCLSAKYWAILPFQLGENNIVKYRLVPDDTYKGAPFDDKNYLRLDLEKRLRNKSAKFRFEIQPRTNDNMPLNNAQDVWSEEDSPYICIAELYLEQQDITAIGQAEFGSNLSFNIWRTLEAHKPIGSIAEARKTVYAASAEVRHQANGQQQQEPKERAKHFKGNIDESSDCIVRAAIYPPIGITRVGNSKDEYFIGPLVDEPEAKMDQYAYRDKTGALKRQAAQFRIYGFNAAGKAVKELTSDNAKITWHSHLANQKASWYQFQIALDIPDAQDPNIPPSLLRNIDVKDRSTLLIDGGAQSISTPNVKEGHEFRGEFQSKEVYLGEMRTDQKGRLIMLGGHGKSENLKGDIAITFANNEGWYDDTSDGPITAEVEYEGVQLKVEPAWVVCAPPDYAPMQKSVRTMWDLMRDVAVKSGMLERPARPSFKKDILPIFERMTNLQWVNAGFAAAFGWGGQFDYTTVEWVKKLNDPSSANYEMRRTISNNFRRYDVSGAEAPQLWPWTYGDAVSIPTTGSVRQHSTLSGLQLEFLDQWVEGDFDADFVDMTGCPHIPKPLEIDDLPVEEQPDMLTKAAMEFCLADAFHPGCEMTWPMRTSGMYSAPFRLKHAPKTPLVDTSYYGSTMNSDVLTLSAGPLLGGQVPGGITRWMAIPWQTDTASCRDGYTKSYDPYLPTFWPARVPNNILSEERYKETIDSNISEETRKEAFAFREAWLDDLPLDGEAPTQTNQINSMIKYFDKLAVVQARPGTPDDSNFPPKMQVGIIPSVEQEELLFKEAMKELHEILEDKTRLNTTEENLLTAAVQQLSDKKLLTEQELMESAKGQLIAMVEHELKEDFNATESVQKLLNLLASKTHDKTKVQTMQHQKTTRKEVGVPEKMVRFQRFMPK
ncbi:MULTISPECIES: LodA/GoxA family CTQ-dependent oxidase [unclassified Tenacibaculum]|uniref:LodA/GoxA family CTQ-dependent oxidase n=1 Tax=unclassified Tenacibaculum TaxID=2635139 RepID=UPI001F2BB3E8|nr:MULTISPECIES: LodA/GoxA family CTQ-dependent oxidase [unclassified Tenacibaculum]MCF2875083.1 LodA/GoxA family CTQ-dependent oxidase [Tenacibaculum sp. Cn5-1]MCF2935159.1 LodA/GoxA family CTQ-dependent oxidase [Tenacibaculum sp. Cn5-34]MCG7511399.1 LodA/GoxA family CTQ-dependent oxidase [Tenacibaculum sp. Cn5-46]